MSKLSRITQKIFGSNAGINQIGKFGSLAAGAPAYTTDAAQAMALSNWLTGWFGATINGNSPCIEDMNALGFATTQQLAYLFQQGVPEWDAGTTYYVGSIVNVSGVLYISKTNDNLNNAIPNFANWRMIRPGEDTGVTKLFIGQTLPTGYIWANGTTIGSASSGATQRANDDTADLFAMFWGDYTDAVLPVQTSTGSASVRGLSAAADFSANKRLVIPDFRGRVVAGNETMGGTSAAGRLSGYTLGASGGAQSASHTHDISHSHTTGGATSGTFFGNDGPGGGSMVYSTHTHSTNSQNTSTSGSTSISMVQPTIAANYIIKL